jgi:hypothetical protein
MLLLRLGDVLVLVLGLVLVLVLVLGWQCNPVAGLFPS